MLFLESLQLAEEPVILCIRNLRRIEHIVRVIRALELLPERGGTIGWLHLKSEMGRESSITESRNHEGSRKHEDRKRLSWAFVSFRDFVTI